MTARPSSSYPSDLTEAQWQRLEPLLPEEAPVGRMRQVSQREIANAINYRWETGCVWRMLPHDFPPWGTVYAYFRRWQRAGIIRHLRDILLEPRPKPVRRFCAPPPERTSPVDRSPGGSTPHDAGSSSPSDGFSSPQLRTEHRRSALPLPE